MVKILEKNDESWGYDASDDTYVNMFEKGIIDPTKVVRRALIDASSVASLMVSTECMIVDAPEDKAPNSTIGGLGGMGGMGGMDGMY